MPTTTDIVVTPEQSVAAFPRPQAMVRYLLMLDSQVGSDIPEATPRGAEIVLILRP